jgi:hypothetical protein
LILILALLVVLAIGMMVHTMSDGIEAVLEVVVHMIAWPILLIPIGIGIGLWMVSRPEPAEDYRLANTGRIAIHLLVVPALGLWWMQTRPGSTGFPGVAQSIATHLCFGVVWGHMLLVVRQVETLLSRCEEAERPIGRTPSRSRPPALWLPALVLATYWFGPFRGDHDVVYTLLTVGWIICLGRYAAARPVSDKELRRRRPD